MKLLKKSLGAAIIASTAIIPNLVYASTAANTTIQNIVTVKYRNAANAVQPDVTASVQFKVLLVPSAPLVTVNPVTQTTTENTLANITYTLTGTANGNDTYTLSAPTFTTGANLSAAVTPAYSANPIVLGGTTLVADLVNNTTTFNIPWDESTPAASATVNGLTAGDKIALDGDVYTISTVNTSASTLSNNVAVVTLTAPYTGTTIPKGTVIGETRDVVLSFTTGALSNNAASSSYTTAPTVSYSSQTTAAVTLATVNVNRPILAVTKYVRNVTLPAGNPASGAVTIGNTQYFTSGVTGNPGNTMEYVIVVDNSNAGAGDANNIIVSDPIPMFTTLNQGTVYLIPTMTGLLTTAAFPGTALNVAANTDAALYEQATTTLLVYAGAGGSDAGTGGNLAAGSKSLVRFQVTID